LSGTAAANDTVTVPKTGHIQTAPLPMARPSESGFSREALANANSEHAASAANAAPLWLRAQTPAAGPALRDRASDS